MHATFPPMQVPPEETKPLAPDAPRSPTKIPLAVLSLSRICDKETSRYCLGGVKFDRVGKDACAVASDGRVLVVVAWDGDTQDGIVDAAAFGSMLKIIKAKGGRLERCELLDGELSATWKDGTTIKCLSEPLEGSFPRWKEIIPTIAAEHRTVTLNVGRLRKILDVVEAAGAESVRVTVHSEQGLPVVFSAAPADSKVCAVLMPIAGDDCDKPAWLPK